MTINTQGMSYGDGESGKTIEEQRAAIPPLEVTKINLISDALKLELKELINEVLDQRELDKQYAGPYDFPEDDGLDYEIDYMADVDDQRAHHFMPTGINTTDL